PVNGASIVAVVKPEYYNDGGWGSVVNIFMNDLRLDVDQRSGQVTVVRKGQNYVGPVIGNGEKAILCAIVQPTGEVSLYVNGQRMINSTDTNSYLQMTPGNWGGGGIETQPWARSINVGRNDPDGWSIYNGNIGDVLVYKKALTTAERKQLESDSADKFGITLPVLHTITATAGPGGWITPNGAVEVVEGSQQTFTLTPEFGYAVETLLVDGEDAMSEMFGNSYTFYDVTSDHTIEVTFGSSALLYDDWTWYHSFATTEDALPGANPDNDSLPNFAEFALDGDPLSAADSGKIRSRVEQVNGEAALTITLPVLTGAVFDGATAKSATISGVTYIIEGSNDLANFDQVVTEVTPARTGNPDLPLLTIDGAGGWTYRTFRLAGAIPVRGATGFLRVRIEQTADPD
nr:hypothetical protein [Akkermansiaceae bacterium]